MNYDQIKQQLDHADILSLFSPPQLRGFLDSATGYKFQWNSDDVMNLLWTVSHVYQYPVEFGVIDLQPLRSVLANLPSELRAQLLNATSKPQGKRNEETN